MPEIFGENLVWTIKEKIKQIIEDLEPDVHTFIPINLKVQGSGKDWGKYFFLCPGQAIDAVVIDETDFSEGKGRSGFAKSSTLSAFGDTVLDGKLIVGKHLWRGARGRLGLSTPFAFYLFCSDELVYRIQDAGIERWRFAASLGNLKLRHPQFQPRQRAVSMMRIFALGLLSEVTRARDEVRIRCGGHRQAAGSGVRLTL